jgi:hypothetical protein
MEIDMDQSRPFILASKELCYDVNPTLWNVFCALTNRPIGQPNYIWTEQDVVEVMLSRGLNKNEPRYLEEDHGQSEPVTKGPGFNLRRDGQTGSVMAVRHISNTDDSVVYIIGA